MAITQFLDYTPPGSQYFGASYNYSEFQQAAQSVAAAATAAASSNQENGNGSGNGFEFSDLLNNPGGAFLLGLVMLGMSGFRG
jgi:hypothetical protein